MAFEVHVNWTYYLIDKYERPINSVPNNLRSPTRSLFLANWIPCSIHFYYLKWRWLGHTIQKPFHSKALWNHLCSRDDTWISCIVVISITTLLESWAETLTVSNHSSMTDAPKASRISDCLWNLRYLVCTTAPRCNHELCTSPCPVDSDLLA